MAPGPLFTNQHPQNLQHEPNNSTGKKNNPWLSERNVPTSSVMELWPKAKAINEECLVCFWGSRDGFGRVGPKWKNPGTHNTLDWWNRGTRRFWRTLLNHQHHQHLCEPSFTGLPVKKKTWHLHAFAACPPNQNSRQLNTFFCFAHHLLHFFSLVTQLRQARFSSVVAGGHFRCDCTKDSISHLTVFGAFVC